MILFRQGTSDQVMSSICNGKCAVMGHPDKGGPAFVGVHGNEQEVEDIVRQNPELMDFIEPDDAVYMIPEIEDGEDGTTENIAASSSLWGLERTGAVKRPSSGTGVHIYVTDTGIRASHEEFEGRVIPTIDTTSNTLVECANSGDAGCAQDRQGHGTHCAGTAGGKTWGVASGATIHSVKCLSDRGIGSKLWMMQSFDWVTTYGQHPSVISMSIGGAGVLDVFVTGIDAATSAGVTVVVAAGNENKDACNFSPSFVPSAITVGATTSGNMPAGFSNWGSCVDIMAPGRSITSADARSDTGSVDLSGTSMACPHVAGAAAILIENGLHSRDEIFAKLQSTARVGYIRALRAGDPDLFLWIGEEPAPTVPMCPDFAVRKQPDNGGDCRCPTGTACSRDGGATVNCPTSGGIGAYQGKYFSYKCEDCMCY